MLDLKNGQDIDLNDLGKSINRKDKKLGRLEKLAKKLNSSSAINDIIRYSKILRENNKEGVVKIEEEFIKNLKDLQKDLDYYNKSVQKINGNQFLSFEEIEKISSLFNKVYNLIKIETSKLLFFKSFQMIEDNGIKKIILNEDTLDIIANDYGIENPFKRKKDLMEEKNEVKDNANKLFNERNDINERQIPAVEENIEIDRKTREEAIKQFNKKVENIEKEWKNENKKYKTLNNKILEEESKFDKSLLQIIIKSIEKSSVLGSKTVREIRINPNINLEDFLSSEKLKENTYNLNDTIKNLVNIAEQSYNNTDKVNRMKQQVTPEKDINIEDPQFGSFQPVGPSI